MTGAVAECSIANALAVVGERWSFLVLREVLLGRVRFDEIVANTGGSRDILAARLRTLVDAGVLEKRLYDEHPRRFEYLPTESGRALRPILLSLMEWGDRYVTQGPPPTVWEHSCGAELHVATVCAACGAPVGGGGTGSSRLLRLGGVDVPAG
ncbi:winged helix-turn-helix transcriptional regulator [Jiangella alkaliphila]|uniref:DNA-binding transcriptional regulator, HxlR family n=1 Tax=Jiangella alkaliphila TaxID=419479 RepID=A0A1H2LQD8_9ACTN|nr:helix-turn-helix domain-containing protein [Jiangella alkaliphila]SDU83052.1 DNA-binding transcriptional regulator, HxlR family [Jiangella alkaliphila]